MLQFLATVTTVWIGLMVGVEVAVAVFVNPIFDRLPGNAGLTARSDGARVLGRVMPFWYISSVVLSGIWAGTGWGHPRTVLVVVAAVLLLTSVVMSVTLLVPINSRVARWSDGQIPPDWRDQVQRWDRFHHVRVGIIVAAFTLLVVACLG